LNYYAVINKDIDAVINLDIVEFVGGWKDCKQYTGSKTGDFKILLCSASIFPNTDEDLKSRIEYLKRDLEQYQMLYTVTNDENQKLIERNSDLITLVTSMSNFITTHMEGR